MKEKMEKGIIFVFVLVIVMGFTQFGYADNPIRVFVEGEEIVFDVPPQIVGGRTLLPLRGIFESLDLKVGWQEESKTITGTNNQTKIILQLDSVRASVNGETYSLDVPAKSIRGRTMVPARFIAESLGMNVKWDAQDRKVDIQKVARLSKGQERERKVFPQGERKSEGELVKKAPLPDVSHLKPIQREAQMGVVTVKAEEYLQFPYINMNTKSARIFNEEVKKMIDFAIRCHEGKMGAGISTHPTFSYNVYRNGDILSIYMYRHEEGNNDYIPPLIVNAVNIDLKEDKILSFRELANRFYPEEKLMGKMEGALKKHYDGYYDKKEAAERRGSALMWLWNSYYEPQAKKDLLFKSELSNQSKFKELVEVGDLRHMPLLSVLSSREIVGYLDENGDLMIVPIEMHYKMDGEMPMQGISLNVSKAPYLPKENHPIFDERVNIMDKNAYLGAGTFLRYMNTTPLKSHLEKLMLGMDTVPIINVNENKGSGIQSDEAYFFLGRYKGTAFFVKELKMDEAYHEVPGNGVGFSTEAIKLYCNASDLHSDAIVEMRYRNQKVIFSPKVSLKDGYMESIPRIYDISD